MPETTPPLHANTDRNLLFGVIALQADLIDPVLFAEACAAWVRCKYADLDKLLVERGWLSPADRDEVERLLQRKLRRHGGDARASLAAAAGEGVRRALADLDEPALRDSLAGLPSLPVLDVPRDRVEKWLAATPPVPASASRAATSGDRRGRYRLLHLHARGGLGCVWLARDDHLGRDVALKELRSESAGDPHVQARFLEEARVTGQLEHPGIVPVYELAEQPGEDQPFYTMRFIRGRTLSEAVRSYHEKRARGEVEPLELANLLNAFVGVCNAVAYAHARGVLHRDLKPLNVVLGDFGEVSVLDWGLAKRLGAAPEETPMPPVTVAGTDSGRDATVEGMILGTPAYMAPEQALGRLAEIDRRTDVYGLGAILYEVLTGRPPFDGASTEEILLGVVGQPPPRPRQACPDAPPALEAVCLKALAKERQDRYDSAAEVADEVRRFLADEPVHAYPDPWTVRMGRWLKRHQTLAASAAALLVTAVVASTVGLILIKREEVKTETARQQAQANYETAEANRTEAVRQKGRAEKTALLAQNVVEKRLQLDRVQGELQFSPRGFSVSFPNLADEGELIELALSYYRQVRQDLDEDPLSRRQAAWYTGREAILLLQKGKLDEADAKYAEAIAGLEKAPADAIDAAAFRKDLWLARLNHGGLLLAQRRVPDALAAYQAAASMAEEFARTQGIVGQEMLAASHYTLAQALAWSGKLGDAEKTLRTALDIQEKLVDQSADLEIRERLAQMLHLLALVLVQPRAQDLLSILAQPRLQEAEKLWRRAIPLFAALNQERPGRIDNVQRLALVHYSLGVLLGSTPRRVEAITEYRQAIALQEKLVAAFPARIPYRQELGRSLLNLFTLLAQADAPEAEEKGRAAIEAFEWLTKVQSQDPTVDEDLALACYTVAFIFHHQKKWAAFQSVAVKGIAATRRLLQDNARHPTALLQLREFTSGLSQAHYHLGDHAEMVKSLEELARLRPKASEDAYTAACGLALCVSLAEKDERLTPEKRKETAQTYGARAIELLQEAVKRGFKDVEKLKRDPDLEPVRPREDFKKLLGELEQQGSKHSVNPGLIRGTSCNERHVSFGPS